MTNITINSKNSTIVITKAFSKKASRFGSDEYKMLQEARKDYPSFEVEIRTVAHNKKNSLKGLTYDFMRQYIERHDDENGSHMVEFNRIAVKNNDTLYAKKYGEVKKWFLEQFPEVAA